MGVVAELGPGHRETLAALVTERGVPVVPLDSGWVDKGISLGSGEVATLKAPRVGGRLAGAAGWMGLSKEMGALVAGLSIAALMALIRAVAAIAAAHDLEVLAVHGVQLLG